ncbi:MAG TPA: hypothetical protein VFX76_19105, partial [Roseiflexaceae bacterium]|nr:hypothetical protein [Roseiflexaceae bacterium]
MDTLSNLLITFMARARIGSRRLSQRTGIPRTSIDNWRAGTAQRPQQWQPLLIIARILELSQAEVDELLSAANHPSLATLAHDLAGDHQDRQYIRYWLAAPSAEKATAPILPLHQLRAPVADFVGQADAIAGLVTAIQSAAANGIAATISGVRGMGGVGKTELAYMIAAQLVDRFPDAQIVVPLQGMSSAPLSAAQALQQVIHTFTPDAQLPSDLFALQQR